jgi:hypothetical protein
VTSLYTFDGGRYLPGDLTVGPWSPDAQHGGPVCALLAGAVEDAVDPRFPGVDVATVRVTFDLVRPVPLTPLELRAEVVKPGRSAQWVEATLSAGGNEVARARGLRLRRSPVEVPVDRSGPPHPPPSAPDQAAAPAGTPARTAFAAAVDMVFASGGWDELGPVAVWTRLNVPVVEGRTPSPLQRAAAAADFGNGISRVVDFTTHTFVNADLTVALARVPEGEWLLLDVVTHLSADGFGGAASSIYDAAGPVGRAYQSLLVSAR